jgi:hypothetical protein
MARDVREAFRGELFDRGVQFPDHALSLHVKPGRIDLPLLLERCLAQVKEEYRPKGS